MPSPGRRGVGGLLQIDGTALRPCPRTQPNRFSVDTETWPVGPGCDFDSGVAHPHWARNIPQSDWLDKYHHSSGGRAAADRVTARGPRCTAPRNRQKPHAENLATTGPII